MAATPTIIGPPPAARAVADFFRACPDASRLIGQPPPGPTRMEARRVGNAMQNFPIGGAGSLDARGSAPLDKPRPVERTA
jgi:hypothetical protein